MKDDLFPTRVKNDVESAYAEVSHATQSQQDISRIKRATLDLKKTFVKEQNILVRDAVNGDIPPLELTEKLQQLKELEQNISSLTENMESRQQPERKKGKLTNIERKAIYGLYHSGEYKQNELAEIYDVKQPSISSIVRKPSNTFIDDTDD